MGWELYDLENDFELTTNLAEDEPGICEEMRCKAVSDAGGKDGKPPEQFENFTGQGTKKILKLLSNKCGIVVGQSGVGKSSLINHLVTTSQQRTADISSKTGEGRTESSGPQDTRRDRRR